MRIVLVEDCVSDAEDFRRHLLRYNREEGTSLELVALDDGSPLVENVPSDVDAFFLDIEMPGINGLDLARKIRSTNNEIPICFVTNLGYLALEGYEVDAIGFLVKPLSHASFRSVMGRVLRRALSQRKDLVSFQDGRAERILDIGLMPFVETFSRKTFVHFFDGNGGLGELQVRESLNAMETRLARPCLFRVHSSFLINMNHIESVAATDLMVAGRTIPVSKHRKKDLMQALTRYIGKGLR